jgi:hypothetical protein
MHHAEHRAAPRREPHHSIVTSAPSPTTYSHPHADGDGQVARQARVHPPPHARGDCPGRGGGHHWLP